jgi:hypothetical protein
VRQRVFEIKPIATIDFLQLNTARNLDSHLLFSISPHTSRSYAEKRTSRRVAGAPSALPGKCPSTLGEWGPVDTEAQIPRNADGDPLCGLT